MLGFPLAHPFFHLHSNFKVVRYDIFLFVQSFITYFFSRVCKYCGEGLEIYHTSTENVSVQTWIFFSCFGFLIIKGNILKVKIKNPKLPKIAFFKKNTKTVLYWSIADEQCCDSLGWTAKVLNHTHIHVSILPKRPFCPGYHIKWHRVPYAIQ